MMSWLRLEVREMYLTRMYLNWRRRSAMKLLDSPQRMHAAVASCIPPDAQVPQSGRVLWRVDRDADRVALIVVTPREPDLALVVEQAGWQTGEMWQTRSYTPLLAALDVGQAWHFRLTANPTYSGRKPGWNDTKPRGHTTVKQQERWLLDRSAKFGFEIPDGPAGCSGLSISERNTLRFQRAGRQVVVTAATYGGTLQVTDPELMRSALVNGIGRAKAYGCGLLTLAPVRLRE